MPFCRILRSSAGASGALPALIVIACSLAAVPPPAHADNLGFDIDVALSERAAATLASRNEGIVAFASYYGAPKKGAEKHADEVGRIDLTPRDEEVAVPSSGGRAHISGATVDAKRLGWLAGPVEGNVNVASARKSGPDNLLQCDFIEGTLADVRKKAPITLRCFLIEEQPKTEMRP